MILVLFDVHYAQSSTPHATEVMARLAEQAEAARRRGKRIAEDTDGLYVSDATSSIRMLLGGGHRK